MYDADEAIRALQEHPGAWIFDGALLTDAEYEEAAARYKQPATA